MMGRRLASTQRRRLPFTKDSGDLIMIENKVTTLLEAVNARAQASGQAAVSYHSITKKPGEDGFVLKQDKTFSTLFTLKCC